MTLKFPTNRVDFAFASNPATWVILNILKGRKLKNSSAGLIHGMNFPNGYKIIFLDTVKLFADLRGHSLYKKLIECIVHETLHDWCRHEPTVRRIIDHIKL